MTDDVEVKIKPKDRPHYVSNKDLYAAYIEWYKAIIEATKANEDLPVMPRYIAESIMKICTRLAYRPNFINYSFREDMVGDAIENCIRTARNFNPERSDNPFSFVTTIAYNAFLRRIAAEKKQTYVKAKMIEVLPIEELVEISGSSMDDVSDMHNQFIEFLRENSYIVANMEESMAKKKQQPEDILDDEIMMELVITEDDEQ